MQREERKNASKLTLDNGWLPPTDGLESLMVSRITVQLPVLTAELELAKAVNGRFQTLRTKRKDIFQSLPFVPWRSRKYSFHAHRAGIMLFFCA